MPPNNFTREDIFGNRSFLDHFVLTKSINFDNIRIRYDGNNLSDHNPININTTYNAKYLKQFDDKRCKIMNWNGASTVNIQNYKSEIDYYLNRFKIPNKLLECNNYVCKNHDDDILQKLDELFNILIVSAHNNIPVFSIKSKKGMPGWNEFVKP